MKIKMSFCFSIHVLGMPEFYPRTLVIYPAVHPKHPPHPAFPTFALRMRGVTSTLTNTAEPWRICVHCQAGPTKSPEDTATSIILGQGNGGEPPTLTTAGHLRILAEMQGTVQDTWVCRLSEQAAGPGVQFRHSQVPRGPDPALPGVDVWADWESAANCISSPSSCMSRQKMN